MSGCLICGKPLVYLPDTRKPAICSLCGKQEETNVICQNGHFVCDECHAKAAINRIFESATDLGSKNPVEILTYILSKPEVYMHGPEHHILTGASIIIAYCNAKGISNDSMLKEMIARGSQVPGGTCGFWGCCGAALSAGIAYSIITGTTPMSSKEWGNANMLTSKVLAEIGRYGGPRCCKRTSYIAVLTASQLISEYTGVQLDIPAGIQCEFSSQNSECLKIRCPFFCKTFSAH